MKSATDGFIFIGMPNGTAGAVTGEAGSRVEDLSRGDETLTSAMMDRLESQG